MTVNKYPCKFELPIAPVDWDQYKSYKPPTTLATAYSETFYEWYDLGGVKHSIKDQKYD